MRGDERVRGTLVIGHRGAPGCRPEHTASGYRIALDAGVDAVEPDVVVSSDGVLVVRHENEISGTTDVADRPEFAARRTRRFVDGTAVEGWFTEDFTWQELSGLRCRERLPGLRPGNTAFDGLEPILRLRDVLALVDAAGPGAARPPGVVVELKHVHALRERGHDLVALLLAELASCGWADRPDRLIVECFELAPLRRLRVAGLQGRLMFLMEHEGAPVHAGTDRGAAEPDYSWFRSPAGLDSLGGLVDGVSLDKRDVLAGPAIVRSARDRGLSVFAWTLRTENRFLDPAYRIGEDPAADGDWRGEWAAILRAGVDGVFVDHPGPAVEFVRSA